MQEFQSSDAWYYIQRIMNEEICYFQRKVLTVNQNCILLELSNHVP